MLHFAWCKVTKILASENFSITESGKSMEVDLTDPIRQMLVDLDEGQRIPSERALASRFKVSRATVKRALLKLAAEGLIRVTPGHCPRVSKPMGSPLALERLLEVEPSLHQDLQSFVKELDGGRSGVYPTAAITALERLEQIVMRYQS